MTRSSSSRLAVNTELLDSYTSERSAHLQHAISMSVALGRIICVLDAGEARARDERMIAAGADPRTALPQMPPDQLGAGAWDDQDTPAILQASLTPQFLVTKGSETGLFDDVVGTGFTLIGHGFDPRGGLTVDQLAALDVLDVTSVMITDAEYSVSVPPQAPTVHVVAGDPSVGDYFKAAGISAVLVRPDFYLYGAALDASGIGSLVDSLGSDTHLLRGTALASGPPGP